jgi:hypothetical protein
LAVSAFDAAVGLGVREVRFLVSVKKCLMIITSIALTPRIKIRQVAKRRADSRRLGFIRNRVVDKTASDKSDRGLEPALVMAFTDASVR